MKKKIVIIYSILHFVVDFACAILVTNLAYNVMVNSIYILLVVIAYNFFAFAMQLPLGIIVDKINKNAICSSIGLFLVAIAYLFFQFPMIACIMAGIGNALFHLGGGVDVLNISDKKASLSGIFVSTGALGIFLGSMSYDLGVTEYYLMILILFISSLILVGLYKQIEGKVVNEETFNPTLTGIEKLVIVCCTITVIIRGYMGFIFNFEWKSIPLLAFLSVLGVILGKMFGGIIGDKIGFIKSSVISLVIAAIGFIFAFESSIIGIISILLFNMTMPITLIMLSNILDKNKGMAFGILTFALFIGAFPVFFGYTNFIFSRVRFMFNNIIISISIIYRLKKLL